MDGNEDTIVIVSEVLDWSLVEAETVPIEKGTDVEVPIIMMMNNKLLTKH